MEIDLPQLIVAVEVGADDPLDRVATAAALKDHIEAVGDDLLDHFVKAARDDGASWTQIGEALGVTRQAAQQRHGGFFDRLLDRLKDGRLTRFTPRAREAVLAARIAARDRGHPAVGTEHLLVGLYADAGSVAAIALDRLGLDRATAERLVDERFPAGPVPGEGRVPFSPPARKVLEEALGVALGFGHNYIGTEHLVLALGQVGGAAAEILEARGITSERLQEATLARLAEVVAGK